MDCSPEASAKWCQLLPLPNHVSDCIALTQTHLQSLLDLEQLDAQQILLLLLQCDVQRRPQRLRLTLQAIRCYAHARLPQLNLESRFVLLENMIAAMVNVNVKDIIAQGYTGIEIKTQLQAAQLAQINALLHAK